MTSIRLSVWKAGEVANRIREEQMVVVERYTRRALAPSEIQLRAIANDRQRLDSQ